MATYTVSFTVETKRSLGPMGESQLEEIVEKLLDGDQLWDHRGMPQSGLPRKYDATSVVVTKE